MNNRKLMKPGLHLVFRFGKVTWASAYVMVLFQGRIQKFWKGGVQNFRVPNYRGTALTAFWISCSCRPLKFCPPFWTTALHYMEILTEWSSIYYFCLNSILIASITKYFTTIQYFPGSVCLHVIWNVLFWPKTNCLKCYTMYNILIIIQHAGHMSNFFYRKHQMTHFLRLFVLLQCKHVLQKAIVAMQTCTSESFSREATPALSFGCRANLRKHEKLQY